MSSSNDGTGGKDVGDKPPKTDDQAGSSAVVTTDVQAMLQAMQRRMDQLEAENQRLRAASALFPAAPVTAASLPPASAIPPPPPTQAAAQAPAPTQASAPPPATQNGQPQSRLPALPASFSNPPLLPLLPTRGNQESSQAQQEAMRIRAWETRFNRDIQRQDQSIETMRAELQRMEAQNRYRKLRTGTMLLAAQLRNSLRLEAEGVFNQNAEELRNVEHTPVPDLQQAAYRAVRRLYHLAILKSIQRHRLNLNEDHSRVQNMVDGWTEDTATSLETDIRNQADRRRSELTSAYNEANREREFLNRWVSEGGMPPDNWLYMPGETLHP